MKHLLYTSILLIILGSCKKEDFKKNTEPNLVYYSEDYQSKDFEILGKNTSEIDALWVEFYDKDEDKDFESYALIVKANGEFTKELGTCNIDWYNQISFYPDNGTKYYGNWIVDKEKYSLNISEASDDIANEITFIYKEVEKFK